MSHFSGTRTAFRINNENYRQKLISSVNKHINEITPKKLFDVETEED